MKNIIDRLKNGEGSVNLVATNDQSQPYLDRLKNGMNVQNGLLRAIVECYNQHRHYPYVDDDALQWFLTYWLGVDVTPRDLMERVTILWQKYEMKLRDDSINHRSSQQKLEMIQSKNC